MSSFLKTLAVPAALAGSLLLLPASATTALADEATLADIEATFGGVPTFLREYPPAILRGAWQMMKALELSEDTELSGKEKQLIGLAVAAQIPCSYCIWVHANEAKGAGATEGEIREAVAMAAYVRHWSTVLNGMQIDLDEFKAQLSGEQ